MKAERVVFTRGDQVEPQGIEWVVPCFVQAGGLTLIGGDPGTGKTSCALAMAATISAGAEWPTCGVRAKQGTVLIWSGEDHFETSILPRFIASGGDRKFLEHISGVKAEKDRCFNPAKDIPLITERLQRGPEVSLLILDPIRAATSGVGESLRASLQVISDVAMSHGIGVIGITHLRKNQSAKVPSIHNILGSIDYVGVSRAVLLATTVLHPGLNEPVKSLVAIKMNSAPTDHHLIYDIEASEIGGGIKTSRAHLEEILLAPLDQLFPKRERVPSETVQACAEIMEEMLSGGARLCDEVRAECEARGFTPKIVRMAREHLGLVTIRQSVGEPALWALQNHRHPGARHAHSPNGEGTTGVMGRAE